jgi:hypothetical protein
MRQIAALLCATCDSNMPDRFSRMANEQSCALCNRLFAPMERSHIVSKFVYQWLKDTSVTGFMRFGPQVNRRDQDGIKDYFLCKQCEDRFSAFETSFAREVFHPFTQDNSICVDYNENVLKFAVSESWRILAYIKQKRGLPHFRGRHESAVAETLSTWRNYLLGLVGDIGRHEIHLLPFCGVVDCTGADVPPNLNRYLRRAVEIDVTVSDAAAFTYCKLGPLILIGLIEYPDVTHWENTKIGKSGRLAPGVSVSPMLVRDYVFKRSQRLQELESCLSNRQLHTIEQSYRKNAQKFERSETLHAALLDLELQSRRQPTQSE